jgi:hypothetical protein
MISKVNQSVADPAPDSSMSIGIIDIPLFGQLSGQSVDDFSSMRAEGTIRAHRELMHPLFVNIRKYFGFWSSGVRLASGTVQITKRSFLGIFQVFSGP